MRNFVRILKASDTDGTAEGRRDRLSDLLDPKGWSLFATAEDVTPLHILGAYFGMRRGKQPGPFAYRLFIDEELQRVGLPAPRHDPDTEGTLPPRVAQAHYNLFLTETHHAERLDQLMSTKPILEHGLVEVLAEQVRIHNDETVIDATRKNIRERIQKMGKQLREVGPLVTLLRLS